MNSTAFLHGWLMTAGLIAAIGAQNALVLRQGLQRRHVGAVVAFCTLSDWLLTVLGVFGFGALVKLSPWLLQVFRLGGAVFLIAYGLRAAQRAFRASSLPSQAAPQGQGVAATLGMAAALTYLNPHVYLDTVVLLGGVGAQYLAAAKLAFIAGAGLASLMWFAMLGYGAAVAAPWLARPSAWRVIDAMVAFVMFGIAWQLLTRPL
jgi:L-lysine exporter family protein LysE/ArgO